MDPEEIARQLVSEEMKAEIDRMRKSSFGICDVCGDSVSEWDLSGGPYGGEFIGETVVHTVCRRGKVAVAV